MTLFEELQWRGMVHNHMPGTEALINNEQTAFYVGIDPTADSLHVGHFVSVMMMGHLQRHGHRPLALIGGATGMIGDPSGKSSERNLLDETMLRHNEDAIAKQLHRFLDFEGENAAEVVNNYDWFKEISFLEFIRDVGKHITVNYMLAKDSVKTRLETGISFTEFTYQLAQGYDFYYLNKHKGCRLQMGGSDQWGNIVTGTELIRRKNEGETEEAFALTWPLITKSDGKKFGKTEQGNIWLDRNRTSPYAFYQFWLNTSDVDALKYLKTFTFMSREDIESLMEEHNRAPHLRMAQNALAEDLTKRVHSEEDLENAKKASSILFGKATKEGLAALDKRTFLEVFEGVPQFEISKEELSQGVNLVDLLANNKVLVSRSEVMRALKENSISINKEKGFNPSSTLGNSDLLNDQFILVQRGKKNYYILVAN
ncbi:MAG: tyrosyl-tRNA synthetase [Limisphaerales bacterium]|jgi:tyrosyl-tRNA synthetase